MQLFATAMKLRLIKKKKAKIAHRLTFKNMTSISSPPSTCLRTYVLILVWRAWYTSSQVKITLSFCIARLNSTGFITSYLFSLRKPETRLTHSNQHPQLAWGYWRGLPNSLYPPFPRHPLLPTSRQVRHR